MKAPDFTLKDQDGKTHTLSEYAGTWILLFFYPKDDTPGCTIEACNFRDAYTEYKKRGITILGVSKDTVRSKSKFAQKFSLNFPILADEQKEVAKAYGALGEKSMYGKKFLAVLRNSYLINPKGTIVKEYLSVNPQIHSEEIVKDFDMLVGSAHP